MIKLEHVQTLPDRNFCAGFPRNPATYVAYGDNGETFEGFVSEYTTQVEFEADATAYFNRDCVLRPWAR